MVKGRFLVYSAGFCISSLGFTVLLLLTVLVFLVTVIFTWVIALPTGIYSAVRQYSPGDYLLTFLGFLGVSIPSFLLALVIMYLTKR